MGVLTAVRARARSRASAGLLVASCLLVPLSLPAMPAQPSAGNLATVQTRDVAQTLSAYGQIEPIAMVQVRAVDAGTLSALEVVPGSVVKAGQVLARIAGPRMRSVLVAREEALRSAQAREDAARRALGIVRRKLAAQLATRQEVDAAQSELAAARASVETAGAQLGELQDLRNVRAPAAGTVVAIHAANGEQTTAGETLLTLQPAGKLWIRATYYGADAGMLRIGMKGRFQPGTGDKPIAVKVAAVSSALGADTGMRIGLVPASSNFPAAWMNGQWGTVTLEGPSRAMVEVPTTALILDGGRWWVLVHTPQGDKPQQVVPGPSRGWQTSIASGLRAGEQVVAQDAFLEYHRGIAQSYQPPD